MEQMGLEFVSIWNASPTGGGLACYITALGPESSSLCQSLSNFNVQLQPFSQAIDTYNLQESEGLYPDFPYVGQGKETTQNWFSLLPQTWTSLQYSLSSEWIALRHRWESPLISWFTPFSNSVIKYIAHTLMWHTTCEHIDTHNVISHYHHQAN